jgi:cytochrome c551/c552
MSKNIKIIIGVIAVIVVGFLGIQLIPVSRTNPPILTQIQWDSPQTEALMRKACYDCHSNETVWPWYAHVAPVSWLVAHDVEEGRHHLNLSERPANRIRANEMVEIIQEGEMPPSIYLIMHPDARLSDQEKTQLIDGLRASLGG